MLLYFLISSSNPLNLNSNFKCPFLVFPCSESIPPTAYDSKPPFPFDEAHPSYSHVIQMRLTSSHPLIQVWTCDWGLDKQCIPPPWHSGWFRDRHMT